MTTQSKSKSQALPKVNRGLIQARHIQAHIKERAADGLLPDYGLYWSSMVPTYISHSRWAE